MGDGHVGLAQMVLVLTGEGGVDLGFVDFLSDEYHLDGVVLHRDVALDDLCAAECQFVVDEAVGTVLEHGFPDDAYGGEDGGDDGHEDDDHDVAVEEPPLFLVDIGAALEPEETDAEEGGKTDEDGVDEEEVECSEEIHPLALCQSETRRTEGRHQGCCDGYAWYDVSTFFGTDGYDTSHSAEEGDENVVDVGAGACQEFGLRIVDGRYEKIDGGRYDGYSCTQGIVFKRTFQHIEIGYTYCKPHADDRTHKGTDEHGADDDGCAVDVEA